MCLWRQNELMADLGFEPGQHSSTAMILSTHNGCVLKRQSPVPLKEPSWGPVPLLTPHTAEVMWMAGQVTPAPVANPTVSGTYTKAERLIHPELSRLPEARYLAFFESMPWVLPDG